jgi:hypothetical protein
MSHECCEGVRGLRFSRRYFLKQSGVAMVGLSAMPAFLQRAVAATPMPNKKQLVVLFQRGAADGLNIVVPFGEQNYYRMRPSTAEPMRLSISTDSLDCIQASRHWSRCSTRTSWLSCTRRDRLIRPVRILMPRISWSRGRRD